MAGISFFDLMLADALAQGLAREQVRRERPPPDNVFVIPSKADSWFGIKDACRKENMVFLLDITDGSSENCRRVDNIFFDLAREFDGLPFFLAKVGPFGTHDQLRQDLGGVQYTPTILLGFFGETLKRVKYEGEGEIRSGLGSGRLKAQIKEFMAMRGKLKLVEHVAEGLAEQVNKQMSEREKKIRDEYELKMKRELAEKEEKTRKEEEEKKRLEEEEAKQKDAKRKRNAELRREARPQHLEELLRMDLNTASIKEIKAIMIKMGISPHGCFERADLNRKLKENVPELRIAMERRDSPSSSRTSSVSSNMSGLALNDLDGPMTQTMDDLNSKLAKEKDTSKTLKKENAYLKNEVADFRSQVEELKRQLTIKDRELKSLRSGANNASSGGRPVPAPRTRTVPGEGTYVKELETQLLETRMLYTTNIEDYKVLRVIHDAKEEGMVLSVMCEKPNIPTPNRVYALKLLANYFQTQTQTQVRAQFQNEYQVLCQLSPHKNIIHMWAFFFDRANPDIIPQLKSTGSNARTMSLFLLMDQHSMSMREQVATLVENRGPIPGAVTRWFKELLEALVFLEQSCVVHRDLKLDNLLLSTDGNLIVSDFGKAALLDQSFTIPFMHGTDRGGNDAHLSPEVLNARAGPRKKINYSKQPVWAAGVLAYELAGHPNPFQRGTIDQRGYNIDQLPPLNDTYCKHSRFCQALPRAFTTLVTSMLQPESQDRPTLSDCLFRMNNI